MFSSILSHFFGAFLTFFFLRSRHARLTFDTDQALGQKPAFSDFSNTLSSLFQAFSVLHFCFVFPLFFLLFFLFPRHFRFFFSVFFYSLGSTIRINLFVISLHLFDSLVLTVFIFLSVCVCLQLFFTIAIRFKESRFGQERHKFRPGPDLV